MASDTQRGIKGPAIFLAQFAGDAAPFDSLPSIAKWAADLGYRGIQVPVDPRFIDLDRAAEIATQNPYWSPRPVESGPLRALLQRAWDGAPPQP